MELRDFTKHDWYGWAGAEPLDKDTPPKIGEGLARDLEPGVTAWSAVIADRTGVCVTVIDDNGAEQFWSHTGAAGNWPLTVKIASIIPEDDLAADLLEQIGFERFS